MFCPKRASPSERRVKEIERELKKIGGITNAAKLLREYSLLGSDLARTFSADGAGQRCANFQVDGEWQRTWNTAQDADECFQQCEADWGCGNCSQFSFSDGTVEPNSCLYTSPTNATGPNQSSCTPENWNGYTIYSGAGDCQQQHGIVFPYTFPNGFAEGDVLTITGAWAATGQYVVNFYDAADNILFHFNGRDGVVVRNSKFGSWGSEERDGGQPLTRGTPATLQFTRTATGYSVSIDGTHFTDYASRSGEPDVRVDIGGFDNVTSSFSGDTHIDTMANACKEEVCFAATSWKNDADILAQTAGTAETTAATEKENAQTNLTSIQDAIASVTAAIGHLSGLPDIGIVVPDLSGTLSTLTTAEGDAQTAYNTAEANEATARTEREAAERDAALAQGEIDQYGC
eukprot:TRINITY_DN10344_c0_g1_i2.p1 TRINITY_DN10344_c0_g1~~TRINITY_DN10344_c0_g1_i2.p1  ORF type:complete len:403 (-),score=99.82 TRINITY_DN10344_c0_g1_i2:49-1257(-)